MESFIWVKIFLLFFWIFITCYGHEKWHLGNSVYHIVVQ